MIKLQHGDCFEKTKVMQDKSIQMILTDIPYGEVNRKSQGIRIFDKGIADENENINLEVLVKLLCNKVTGSIYIFCGTEQVSELRHLMVEAKMSTRLCIWEKTNPSPVNGQHLWLSSIECCVFGRFKGATFNEHCKGTVWKFPNGSSKIHPTQKSLRLFEYLVSVSSNENDIIFDPFMGSGTSGVACVNLKRNFIGIEKEREYFNIAVNRIKESIKERLFTK
jgi:DNA modification methylase